MPFPSDGAKQPDFSEVRKATDRQDKINDVGDSVAKAIQERLRIQDELKKATDAKNRRTGESSRQD